MRTGIGRGITLTEALAPRTAEHGMELNLFMELPRGIHIQPVARYSIHSGGSRANAAVFSLRTKVDF